MAAKSPKIVLADKREWARNHYLGDADPNQFPQMAQKAKDRSFEVLSIHNAIDYEIGENLSPMQVHSMINAGWAVDIRPYKDK